MVAADGRDISFRPFSTSMRQLVPSRDTELRSSEEPIEIEGIITAASPEILSRVVLVHRLEVPELVSGQRRKYFVRLTLATVSGSKSLRPLLPRLISPTACARQAARRQILNN